MLVVKNQTLQFFTKLFLYIESLKATNNDLKFLFATILIIKIIEKKNNYHHYFEFSILLRSMYVTYKFLKLFEPF